MHSLLLASIFACLVLFATSCRAVGDAAAENVDSDPVARIQFLEIVTPDVSATCSLLEKVHGAKFGAPVAVFGNARTMKLLGGGVISVRAPMRDTEDPVVRPYALVEDIDAAMQAVEASGAKVAMPPMEMPGQGKFAIYILGGIQHGLWQLPAD